MHRGLTNHEDFVEAVVAGAEDEGMGAFSVHDHIEDDWFAFDELDLSCCNVHIFKWEMFP